MFAECGRILVTGALPISLFTGGLVGGFTHCAGMCGPFVIAQTGRLERISPIHIFSYHLGRATTYVTLAVLVSSVLNLAFVASPLKSMVAAPMLALAGVIFIVSAFPSASSVFPWARTIRIGLPQAWLTNASRPLMRDTGFLNNYALGILLGFMPCGLVMSALLAASTAPNTLQSAVAMGAFAAGTIPALITVAIAGKGLKAAFPRASFYLFRTIAIFNGIWLFVMSALLLGIGT